MRMRALWLATLMLAMPAAVAADWQYTSWGMPFSEVKAAAEKNGGEVVELASSGDWPRARLRFAHAVGSIQMQATLYFDQDEKLAAVRLAQESPFKSDTDEVLAALKAKYGEASLGGTHIPAAGVDIREYRWVTPTDKITYSIREAPLPRRAVLSYLPSGSVTDSL